MITQNKTTKSLKNKSSKSKIFTAIFLILITTLFVSADYSISNPQLTKPGLNSANYNYGTSVALSALDKDRCEKGQDFLLQVAPFGCTPSIVRSDLLEEQNVPVFCQLAATQINPLIDINAINYISFKGKMPEGVNGVGFHPAKAAIDASRSTMLNSPILENVGYAVIVLKKQKNESSMPDSISGTLTANIKYDVRNTFGIGKTTYYLPELTQNDWTTKFTQYGFWRNKGYLRADSIGDNSATISVYSNENDKISTTTLSKGQTSSQINLPGFYCLAGMSLRLDGLENPDTRAKFNINGEIIEVAEDEKFLENKCYVTNLEKRGLVQDVSVTCKSDEGTQSFNSKINPKVNLEINGVVKNYNVGDYLYVSADNEKAVYLGYIGTKKDSESLDDLYVRLVAIPRHDTKLLDSELEEITNFDRLIRDSDVGIGIIDAPADLLKIGLSGIVQLKNYLGQGKSFARIDYDTFASAETFKDSTIKIIGFAEPIDTLLEEESKKNYDLAMQDYRTIIDSFPNAQEVLSNTSEEKILEAETFGEQAFFNAIQLAKKTEQKKTMLSLCHEFKEKFPESQTIIPECDNQYKNSNQEFSTESVLINNEIKSISFEGIYEPSIKEFSAVIRVKNASGSQTEYTLQKDTPIYLTENTNEYIELVDLEQNSATLRIHLLPTSKGVAALKFISLDKFKLEKNKGISQGGFVFTLTDVKLKKVAKVSVLPKIDNTGTEANFSFNIGIEKRAIQLAPDEIEDRIEDLENLIEDWQKISNDLGETVKTFNAACLSIGILLTAKNFFDNTGGQSIARNKVMRSQGGWVDVCKEALSTKKLHGKSVDYSSLDDCFLENSDSIDKDIDTYYNAMKDISITEKNKDTETALLASSLEEQGTIINPENPSESIDTKNLVTAFNYKGEENRLRVSQVRDLKAIETALNNKPSEELKNLLEVQKYKLLSDINVNVEAQVVQQSFIEKLNAQGGLTGITVNQYGDKNTIKASYEGGMTTSSGFGEIEANANVEAISYKGRVYIVNLAKLSGNTYQITNIFDSQGNRLLENPQEAELDRTHTYDATAAEIRNKFTFQEFDRATYQNKFKNPEVKYFETEPYKGMAAQVPFDLENGWYVAMKQTLPTGGQIRTYDASGAVSSFYLCNVGENGKVDFNSGVDSDTCQGYNPGTGQIVGEFSGLSPSEVNKLVSCATDAINDANKAYGSGVVNARISTSCGGSINLNVGNPEVGIPEMQCQDFMSPKDCQLLFNVCDPVVCPSSRCNLGGTYHSSNVIQSGIIGSIALCLPNFKEKIFIPICLSGLKAGIDNLLSMFTGYKDCLQTQLDSGETVGICDELHSIYLCEFFWREALPFAETIIPKIFASLLGQGEGTRGGGEYLGVQSAWDNAQGSVDYMSDYYGRDITNAFKVKITEEIGGAICKNFISANYPSSGEVLDSLVEPDSPPQYTAHFSEIPFTTATVPATSQYKVFYHIYAGANSKAYYQVYLKTPSGTSLYQTTPTLTVASGFISAGDYADETKDFTAATGYKELCININGEENCGFQQVSTSFAIDYVEDQYLKEQAEQTDIKSETDCVSGTSSVYSLLQPNVQEGISEVANPAIYDRGIIRVCATDSPGKGTDIDWNNQNAKWQQVGTCDGERGELKCWLDTSSVKDVIKTTSIENETLGEVSENYVNILTKEGNYLPFAETITKINTLDSTRKTNYITGTLIGRAFFNYQKAKLYLIRGNAYGDLVSKTYQSLKKATTSQTPKTPTEQQSNLNTIFQNCKGQYDGQCEVAKEIIKLAREIKDSRNIDDSTVKDDTKADCFEQLILMQAMQESGVSHCRNKDQWSDGKDFANDLTCDGDPNYVLKAGGENSLGVMQINTDVHKGADAYDFESNVKYGINLLADNYNTQSKTYACKSTSYSGWKRALRHYNGWNTDCSKGDVNYVDNTISQKYVVESFGDVCDTTTTTEIEDSIPTGSLALKEGEIKHPIFEIQDNNNVNLYYVYSDRNGWFWSVDKEDYNSDDWNSVNENIGFIHEILLFKDDENFIKSLVNKNYAQGLKSLIDESNKRNEEPSRNVELVTENVLYEPTGITNKLFNVEDNEYTILLKRGNRNWEYKVANFIWKEVNEISEDASSQRLLSKKGIDLIKSLYGKNFDEGAEMIFNVDTGIAYTAQSALNEINSKGLSGNYEKNKEFIDKLYREGVLTFSEYNEFLPHTQKGIIQDDPETINKLKELLERKIAETTILPKYTTDEAIEEINKFLANPEIGNVYYGDKGSVDKFIDEICEQEIFKEENTGKCIEIRGFEGLSVRNLEYAKRLLEIQKIEEKYEADYIYPTTKKINEGRVPITAPPITIWTLESAYEEVSGLRGSYSDNKQFIDELCNQKTPEILTSEECDEIDGGLFGMGEEDMTYVRNLLLQKQIAESQKEIVALKTPEEINKVLIEAELKKRNGISNSEAKEFARVLVSGEFLTNEEFDKIENIDDIIKILESKMREKGFEPS